MEHIWSTYGKITTLDLTANEERMYSNWNPPTPIETLYEQLTDGQQFAMQGGETIHDSQLVRKGYEIIRRTGLFTEDCKEWRKIPEDEQTFDNFKQFFTAAGDDRRKNSATNGSSGYSANTIEEIVQHQMNNILHVLNLVMGWQRAEMYFSSILLTIMLRSAVRTLRKI